MAHAALISGWSWKLGRPFAERLEAAIRGAVAAALDGSGVTLDRVDTVVTVASDTLDGMSVPGRSEIAGNYGRYYMNVPSAAGHGFGAAAALIEAGEAENVLLVGWGAASKLNQEDIRRNQADPFYARRAGASPRMVAALQAQELLAIDGDEKSLDAYAREMAMRAWQAGSDLPKGAMPAWARSAFCDGVVALVMRRAKSGEAGIGVRDYASVSRAYSPEDEQLDPAVWVSEAMSGFAGKGDAGKAEIVEVAAPTAICETRAFSALGTKADFNTSGGGATAYFGAATGLRQLAAACKGLQAMRQANPSTEPGALVLDLVGPAGQHASAIHLKAGRIQ